MRLLLIEDDAAVSRTIAMSLTSRGFIVQAAMTGEDGFDMARFYEYEAILLDLGLPDMSGRDVLKKLRLNKVATPVVLLTAAGDNASRLAGFESGADDYVTKPFNPLELVARVNAIVRRKRGFAHPVIDCGTFSVDTVEKTALTASGPIPLPRKLYAILEILALQMGETVTREQFLNGLYEDDDDEPDPKIIDVFVCNLRKKLLEATGQVGAIQTVWGRGFKLVKPEARKGGKGGLAA